MTTLNKIRNAASVIIFRPTNKGISLPKNPFDYEVLFMKRHSKQKFMPNSYVFPGGSIDAADLERKQWAKCFQQNLDSSSFLKLKESLVHPVVPKMYTSGSNSSTCDQMPNQLLYRVAALREVLEETGVFISGKGAIKVPDSDRKEIHADATKFIDLCMDMGTFPNIGRLSEWSIWLTPTGLDSRRRFDTMFYSLILDKNEALENDDFTHDEIELTNSTWGQPHQFLQNYQDYLMHPPQAFELSRMVNFKTLSSLEEYCTSRASNFGTETWMQVVRQIKDEKTGRKVNISIMPGDYLYPNAQYESDYKVVSNAELYFPEKGEIFSENSQYKIWEDRKTIPNYYSDSPKKLNPDVRFNRGYWFNDSASAKNPEMKSTRILYVSNYSHNFNAEAEKIRLGQIAPVPVEEWPEYVA